MLSKRSHQPTVKRAREKIGRNLRSLEGYAFSARSMISLHVARVSEKMRYDNGSGALAQAGFNRLCGNIACSWIDIGEDWNGALIKDRSDRPHIGDWRGYNFISGFRIDRGYCRVHCSGS